VGAYVVWELHDGPADKQIGFLIGVGSVTALFASLGFIGFAGAAAFVFLTRLTAKLRPPATPAPAP
jgi:hypothetical protein